MQSQLLLVANPKLEANNVAELIKLAKANPGKLNYGSTGVGNPLSLTMEMLKSATGIEVQPVTYRGDAPANAALMAGEIQLGVMPMATTIPLVEGGQLKALAVGGAKRAPALPNVPTVAETIPGFESTSWQGYFVPAGTPREIVLRLQQETAKVLQQPDVIERLKAGGNEGVGGTPKSSIACSAATSRSSPRSSPMRRFRSWIDAMRGRPAILAAALALLLAAAAPDRAAAETYPSRPIRLIVPFPPGGAADILARLIGGKISEQMGQPVIVENRPGAGGTLGADAAAKSPPDGYTILHNTNGAAIAPALYRTLPFDTAKDFAPVTQIVASNLVLVASPKSGIASMQRAAHARRANPGKLNYGSSGPGNPLQLTMEMLKRAAGIDIVAVPFRGDGQIHTALIAGEIEVAVIPLAAAVPLIQEGRLVALAVTGPRRSAPVANVPTVAEAANLPGFASAG